MFRKVCLVLILIQICIKTVESVQIEYPIKNKYIEERIRSDLNLIDPLLRYYVVQREIQFQSAAVRTDLSFFLRCKGSKKSINFTVPSTAIQHLTLTTDTQKNTITAELRRKKLTNDLVGRYTCSETIENELEQTTVHVYIFDGRTVFTKKLYPSIAKETGIHFFNVPCQTTNWYAQISCPTKSNERNCEPKTCTPQERQTDELKCNMPVCKGQQLCIPVSFTPADSKAEKVLFDPQIGFALFNPTLPTKLSAFTCSSLYTPRQVSRVPFDASDPDFIQIHQPSLSVTKDETLKLTCEIQYGSNIDRSIPNVFWFEDIHNLNLVTNETDKPLFQTKTQLYSRNTTIVLRGFKSNQVYRFYCVRVSDQGLYTRSVDITCANASTLDVEISSSGSDPNEFVSYGSDGVYYISIFTIPRSPILLELSRKNVPLTDDKRIILSEINNQDNQFFEYTLTISKMTFEDAEEIKLLVKSSTLEKIVMIKPNLSEDPIGQLGFLDQSTLSTVPWRDADVRAPTKIYPYGITPGTSYRIICSMRHRADINTPLKVFIQYFICKIDNCLSTLIDKTCQTSSKDSQLTTVSNRIDDYQTNFISTESHRLTNPSMAYQYLCCYENKRLVTIGKAIAVASNARELFYVQKPEFTLVKGDILTYSCQAHDLLYRDLRIFYHDDYSTYETSGYDRQWRVKGTNQVRTIGLQVSSISEMRTTGIEVKTPPMQRSSSDYTLQCIAQSKRPDIFSDKNDTYVIRVDDPVPLKFKVNNLPTVSMMVKKSSENILLDCTADGRPEPKIVWYRGKSPLIYDNLTLEFGDNNQSISIKRAQPIDTGYYTCELNNGRDPPLKRSFDLRIKGSNPYSRIGRLITAVILIAILFLILLLALLTFLLIKYIRMKKVVNDSIFHHQEPTSPEDPSQSALSQLTNMRLPDNFASSEQIQTLLNYVNGDTIPDNQEDFKALGRGQFGVVYQVRLPTVGLVAAKCLPDNIRRAGRRGDKRKRSRGLSIDEETDLNEHETQKRKAAEMLIDEIKVMHRAGKHVNIVALKKVAYPATRFKFVFTSKPMRDEDSFYLMELCGNGSLESMLKRFLQSSMDPTSNQRESLYQKLAKTNDQEGMNLSQACDQCQLTEDDLKLIAYQVACGIDYLNRRQIAHCDIAARNVLVNSRFVMKICDFGLATWTTYRNYREQLANNDSVHLEKKTTDIATHNLTPELGKAFLNPSDSDERLLLKKASIKADVWSFGIFLWSLFLKCKFQPFYQLSQEVDRSGQRNFFYRLAREVSEGHVLQYIDYQPEIPANVYAVIQLCLVEESQRPETPRVRALLCHSKMLSKQAFEYYRMEYNRYQEENSTDDTIECFGDYQGIADLPSFDETKVIKKDDDHPASTTTDDFSYAYGDDSYPLTEKDKQQPSIDPKKPTQTGTTGDPVDSYL